MGIFDRFLKPNVKKLKEKRDIQRLSEALSHKDEGVRTSAADALGEIGDKIAIDALIKTLEDRNEKVRQSAAEALGKTKDNSAIRPLIKALEDSNNEVCEEVARALRHFKTAQTEEALRGYEVRQREARIAKLDYVVGRHLVKDGYYKKQIGTEIIGYFDPLKVVFRLFDKQGRRITAGGSGTIALVWPPDCGSEKEQIGFEMDGRALAQALEAYPSQFSRSYLMSNPLGEIGKLLPNLERVGGGEVNKLISESTVFPFFQRYSAGGKTVMIDEVVREVRLNALFNFLCSEVVDPLEDIGTDKFKRRATEMIRQIKGRTTT